MSVWQPIETAPKAQWVLVYCDWTNEVRQARFNTGRGRPGWHVCFGAQQATATYGTPTHWMPLPAPPVADVIGPKGDGE